MGGFESECQLAGSDPCRRKTPISGRLFFKDNPQILRLRLRMTIVLGMGMVERVGVAIPLKPTEGLNGAPQLLMGDSYGTAEAVPLLRNNVRSFGCASG